VRVVPFPAVANGAGPAAGTRAAERDAAATGEAGDEDSDDAQIEADAVEDPLLTGSDWSGVTGGPELAGYAHDAWSRPLGPGAFLAW